MREPGSIDLSECTKCGSVTLNPQSDTCACGCEFYPVSKIVKAGTRIRSADLGDVEPPRKRATHCPGCGSFLTWKWVGDPRRCPACGLDFDHCGVLRIGEAGSVPA